MDVDCSTKTANENSKKVFLLIKDHELEITMIFSWWQFRKLTGEIRFFFSFLLFQESWAFKSGTATANTELACRWCFSSCDPADLWLSDWWSGQLMGQKTKPLKKREAGKTLFWGLRCRSKLVIIQLIWRRRLWLLLCSALSFTCFCE